MHNSGLTTIFRIVILIFFVSIQAYAQQLNLDSYLKLVAENNSELKLGAQQQLMAKEDSKIAKSYILPTVSFETSYQRDFTKNYLFINDGFGGITEFQTNFNNTIDITAVASQVIYDATVQSNIKLAKLAEELAKLNYDNLSVEMLTQSSSLYWQCIYLKESVTVLEANVDLAKEQYDQIEKIFEKGSASRMQLQQAKGFYTKTIPSLNQARNQYLNLSNELKALANIPMDQTISLSGKLEEVELNPMIVDQEYGIDNQVQIKALKKEVEISSQDLEAKKEYWKPKVNLVAGYNFNGQDDNFKFGNNKNRLFYGQLAVSIPLYSGGLNKAKIAKAIVQRNSAEINLDIMRRDLLKELQIARNDYQKAIENISLHKQAISINESEIDIFKKQLKLGVVTPLDFKESVLRLTQSRLALLNSYLDLRIAHIQIARITGSIQS